MLAPQIFAEMGRKEGSTSSSTETEISPSM